MLLNITKNILGLEESVSESVVETTERTEPSMAVFSPPSAAGNKGTKVGEISEGDNAEFSNPE